MTLLQKITLTGFCALTILGVISNANATPIPIQLGLSLAETGYATVFQTGTNPLIVSQTFGTFSTTGNIGTNTSAPSLDLSSVEIASATGGTLVVTLSANGFTTPLGAANWLSQFSGNFVTGSGTVKLQTYLNNDNTLFTTTGSGVILLSTLIDTATPFGISNVAEASTDGSFALTEVMTITTIGAAHVSLDGSISYVPEPASTALLGIGMIGTAFVVRRRRLAMTTPTAG